MSAEFIQPDLMPALPEMVMLGMTCLVLVVDLFLPQEKRGFTLLLAVATLALAIAAVAAYINDDVRAKAAAKMADWFGETPAD